MVWGPWKAVVFKLMEHKSKYMIFADLVGFSSDTEQAVFHTPKPGKALLLLKE